jgi:hypothetical protein
MVYSLDKFRIIPVSASLGGWRLEEKARTNELTNLLVPVSQRAAVVGAGGGAREVLLAAVPVEGVGLGRLRRQAPLRLDDDRVQTPLVDLWRGKKKGKGG